MTTACSPSSSTRKRNACDKCHSLKSKCMRVSEDTGCKRCARLGLDCVYSAPLPLGRPKGRKRPNSSNNTISPQVTGSYIGQIDATKNLGNTYTYWVTSGDGVQRAYVPSLYGSLSSEPTSSENGSNDYAVSLHPNPAPLNMRFPATSAQPTDAAELHQTPIENSVSNHMLDQIDMRLFPLDLNLSAANPNSYTSKDYTEDSYSRLYQIYRLHTRIQELVSPFSAETHLPSANAPSFSREPSLADILSAADDLVQLTDDMVRPGNSFAGDVFQPGIPQYPLQPGLGPALPSDTISSTDPTSFPIILSCYANLLQIYEAVTSELFVLARNQSLTTIQMLQPHNHQPGATLYPSQMPNIRLGRLTLLSDAEPNVNFLVSLVSQSIERLRNAVWYYSTVPRPVYPHQPSRHLTGDPSIPLMETIPHDIQSREQNILALLHATKAMQSG